MLLACVGVLLGAVKGLISHDTMWHPIRVIRFPGDRLAACADACAQANFMYRECCSW